MKDTAVSQNKLNIPKTQFPKIKLTTKSRIFLELQVGLMKRQFAYYWTKLKHLENADDMLGSEPK